MNEEHDSYIDHDEVEAFKRMSPEELAKRISQLSPEDRQRLDERIQRHLSRMRFEGQEK